jgi:hypothetical protein
VLKRSTRILVGCVLFVLVTVAYGSPTTRRSQFYSFNFALATRAHGLIAHAFTLAQDHKLPSNRVADGRAFPLDHNTRSTVPICRIAQHTRSFFSTYCAITSELFEAALLLVQSAPGVEQPNRFSAAVVATMSARAPPWAKRKDGDPC